MKKIFTSLIIVFVILGFYSCSQGCCVPPPYVLGFRINIRNIAPSVSVVKVSIKNIDKLEPKAKAEKENYTFTRRKKENEDDNNESSWWDDEHFPGNKHFSLTYPLLDVDRVFELKIYKDDVLFLTKKLTFRSSKHPKSTDRFVGYTSKAEEDNMDYVKLINLHSGGVVEKEIHIDLSKKNHK